MPRRPHRYDPDRDRALKRAQNIAIVLMTLGVLILVYMAIAQTS